MTRAQTAVAAIIAGTAIGWFAIHIITVTAGNAAVIAPIY